MRQSTSTIRGTSSLEDGLSPSESDPRSHQQIVYAVASSVIERVERFMGRRFRWYRENMLTLVPHAFEGSNAYFHPRHGVLFGYYNADELATRRQPARTDDLHLPVQ